MLVCLIGFMNAFVRTGGLFSIVPLLASKTLGLSPGQIGSAFALGSVLAEPLICAEVPKISPVTSA